MKFKPVINLLSLTLACACCSPSEVILPNYIGDHMVVQRSKPFFISGTALRKDGSPATDSPLTITWQGRRTRVMPDSCGNFQACLGEPLKEGGPFTLKVGGTTVSDILVGDVFLCSGQSNMELPVSRCLDATGEYVKGYTNNNIRYLGVPMEYSFGHAAGDIKETRWQVLASESTAMDWGAVSYFTARELYESTGVPVGMINASVGGSPIEAWMREGLLDDDIRSGLQLLKNQSYVDSLKTAARLVYSDWQAAHDALPQNNSSVWEEVEMFSGSWAMGPEGETYYGSHLLRKTFNLPSDIEPCKAVLHLGAMRDADSTFVNGVFVGNTTYMYPPRNYAVPSGVLRPGENTVEIHLFSTNNAASFVEDKRYSMEMPSEDIPLEGKWYHKYGKRMEKRPPEIFLHYEPSGLYNGMIAPLMSTSLSGIIWYQGESNCHNAPRYGQLLCSMIEDWRAGFNDALLPFYIIELAAFQHSELTDNDFGWNRVQKEQRALSDSTRHIYVVRNSDLGEWNDIHPQDKKTLGERTAKAILSR